MYAFQSRAFIDIFVSFLQTLAPWSRTTLEGAILRISIADLRDRAFFSSLFHQVQVRHICVSMNWMVVVLGNRFSHVLYQIITWTGIPFYLFDLLRKAAIKREFNSNQIKNNLQEKLTTMLSAIRQPLCATLICQLLVAWNFQGCLRKNEFLWSNIYIGNRWTDIVHHQHDDKIIVNHHFRYGDCLFMYECHAVVFHLR